MEHNDIGQNQPNSHCCIEKDFHAGDPQFVVRPITCDALPQIYILMVCLLNCKLCHC